MPGKHAPVEVRFERHVSPEPNSGCFLWTAYVTPKGYGTFGDGKGTILAHRFAWKLANGPIPAGRWVLHRCDNPSCVNPDHLFLGDSRANIDDCVSKGRQARGERGGGAKLSAAEVLAIRNDPRPQPQIAADYGICQPHVCDIKRRKKWSHV